MKTKDPFKPKVTELLFRDKHYRNLYFWLRQRDIIWMAASFFLGLFYGRYPILFLLTVLVLAGWLLHIIGREMKRWRRE